MTPFLTFKVRIVSLVTGMLLAGISASTSAQGNSTGVFPVPLDEINLSLRPLIRSAANNSWRMDMEDILVKRAEALSLRYDSYHNFKLSGTANYGYQIQETRTNTSDGFRARFNVTAKKPLYTWGAAQADHQFGLLEIERVQQGRKLAFLSIYRDVVSRFLDYAILKQRVLSSRLSNDIVAADVDLRREQVDRGEFPATQFASLELNYKQEELRHDVLENSLKKASDELRELIGLDEQTEIDIGNGIPAVADELVILKGRIGNFVNTMDTNSLRVGEKKSRLDQERERMKKLEVNQRPKINGLVQFRQDSDNVITGDRQNLEFNESIAGLEVFWNVYDGKSTVASIKESLEIRRQLERELAKIKRDLEADLGFFLADLEIKREISLLSDQKFYWQQGRYRQMEEDVRAGRSPEKDLIAVKRDLERERITQWLERSRYYKTLTNIYVMMEYPSILAYLEE